MTIDESTQRGAAPPPVDLAGHFREFGRAFLPALLIALVVAGVVFGLRGSLTEKEYAVSIITQISPAQTPLPGDAFVEQMRAPFMALSQDGSVLNEVVSEVDTGWDAMTLSAHVQLSPGPSPQLLIFTVTAGSPELAERIAQTMVAVVARASLANHTRDLGAQLERIQAAIAVEESTNGTLAPNDPAKAESDARLADLRAQLTSMQNGGGDELTVLARPERDPAPISPQPVSEALVAGLAAFVIAAELIVLWRSRIGSRPNRTWARRMAHTHQIGFDPGANTDAEVPSLLAAEIAHRQREGRGVLILHGKDAALPRSAVLPNGKRPILSSTALGSPWWRHVDAAELALAVVIVRTRSGDRNEAERAIRQLVGLGVPSWLVLQRPPKVKAKRWRGAARHDEPAPTLDPVAPPNGPIAPPNGRSRAESGPSESVAEDHVS